MRTLMLLLAAFFVFLALCAGCIVAIGPGVSGDDHFSWGWHGKRGSGVSAIQQRDVPEFHAIRVESCCDVEALVGKPQAVSITTDDNLIDDLTTTVEDGVLVISTKKGTNASYRVGPRAVVSVSALDGLTISGSGDVKIDGISGDAFKAKISGSGDLVLAGRATRLDMSISGSGDADLSHLETQDANVSISGSGDVRVRCSGNLSASVSGSGDIDYIGSPHTSISISGSGDVTPVH